MKQPKETQQRYVPRIWREVSDETAKPFPGLCAFCGGPVTNYPYIEDEMLRAVVICKCCSKEGCPHTGTLVPLRDVPAEDVPAEGEAQ
jgi:hypothetical protein